SHNPSSTQAAQPHALSLIECLPVELLVDVFIQSRPAPKISTDKGPFDDTLAFCQRPVPNWAPLMSVCHRFCDVVVATPSMWYRIPVTKNLRELRQRLKRSGEHPVELLLKDSCNDSAVSLLLPHAARIRTIATAPNFSPYNIRCLVPLFKASLPELEDVYILPKMNAYRHDRGFAIGTALALHEILHPRVKRLSSDRDVLPPPESTFWSLQLAHLDLLSQEVTIERRNDILKVLKAIPLLESLAITFPHTLPEDDVAHLLGFGQAAAPHDHHPFTIWPDTPTALTRLHMVKLSGPITHCKAVLHAFVMPALDKLFVNTSPGLADPNGSIVDMFPARLRHLLSQQHTRLHIHAMPDGGGFRLGDCLCDTGRVSSDRFYLRVQSFRWPAVALVTPLGVLRRVFADARLERLEVSYFVREAAAESAGRWREVLQTFGGLKRVTLRGNDKRSGGAMASDIKALQGEGLNPDMTLVDANTDW
ncbi:hypothetical protein V8D89_002446, partial [Ganoderma adspersum]